jgi:glucokinase-like ROK family protein
MDRIGVDLGGTKIAVGVVDGANRIVAEASCPTRPGRGADAVLDDVAALCRAALAQCGRTAADCAGVGVGCPGTCDGESGVVRNAHNLGWEGVPVCAALRGRLGLPCRLRNDADCAALGEGVAGAAQGSRSALLITLGTGIGGGLVIDGKLYSGDRALGGEFGHMCIAMDGEACTCGRRGCWEAYASATALIRQAAEAAAADPRSALRTADPLDGRAVYAAASAGDRTAQEVVARYAAYVGVGLVNLINMLYPEVVLVGGGVAGAGEALFGPVRAYVAARFFVADRALLPAIRPALLGEKAGIVGAAALFGSDRPGSLRRE